VPSPPNPVLLYHITAIPNLPGIGAQGALQSKGWLAAHGLDYSNIAYQGAQGTRANKVVPLGPGGVIHDYVPFYFAPRSPMLLTINSGNVHGCAHRQEDIVHFMIKLDDIVKNDLIFVFFNYNATIVIAECFDDLADMDKIDWPLFFETPKIDGYCMYWKSRLDPPHHARRMETRQAEFLVYESVPLSLVSGIGTYNQAKADQVRDILTTAGVDLPVKAKPVWYY